MSEVTKTIEVHPDFFSRSDLEFFSDFLSDYMNEQGISFKGCNFKVVIEYTPDDEEQEDYVEGITSGC